MNLKGRLFAGLAVKLREALSQFVCLYANNRMFTGVVVGQALKDLIANNPLFKFFKASIKRGGDDVPEKFLRAL
jgi:hypothetical protein